MGANIGKEFEDLKIWGFEDLRRGEACSQDTAKFPTC